MFLSSGAGWLEGEDCDDWDEQRESEHQRGQENVRIVNHDNNDDDDDDWDNGNNDDDNNNDNDSVKASINEDRKTWELSNNNYDNDDDDDCDNGNNDDDNKNDKDHGGDGHDVDVVQVYVAIEPGGIWREHSHSGGDFYLLLIYFHLFVHLNTY